MMPPFTPTPSDQLPTPDELLARLAPQAGEGATGYITPDDLLFAWQAFLSAHVHAGTGIADAMNAAAAADTKAADAASSAGVAQQSADAARAAATEAKAAADAAQASSDATDQQLSDRIALVDPDLASLHSYVTALTRRITDLENEGAGLAPSAGALPVDIYQGQFPTVHFDAQAEADNPGLTLDDGAEHRVTLTMRGDLLPTAILAPGLSTVSWFDLKGALGNVSGAHATVSTRVLSQWIDDGSVLTVTVDKTDAAHPKLRVVRVETAAVLNP
jgi:hypothetical protein